MNKLLWIAFASAATILGGCGAVSVQEREGKTESVGQWLDGFKDLPKTPSQAQAQARRDAQAQPGATSPPSRAPGEGAAIAMPNDALSAENRQRPAAPGCRTMDPYATRLDVDTVYARAMRSYSFRSAEQETMRAKQDPLQWTESNYLHERQPGAYYHLRQTVRFRLQPTDLHSMWIDLEISKRGTGADVAIRYCYLSRDPSVGTIAFHQRLQKRLRDELGV